MTKKRWIDENGLEIPASRVTTAEKLRERKAELLLKKALKLAQLLTDFKEEISATAADVYEAMLLENGGTKRKTGKGNFSFKTFDQGIKIEVDQQERIEFDDVLIDVAKQHFDTFLETNSSNIDELIKELIMGAFNTSRGKLDTKKVLSLVKYRQRISADKYPEFHLAIDAIEKSMSRPSSKRYHRIYQRDNDGKYEAVNLNFSAL